MWLPKDERALLRFYYSKIGDKYNGRLDLDKEMLVATMKLLNSYSKHIEDICAELEIMKSPNFKKVNDAHGHLQERGLVCSGDSGTGCTQNCFGGAIYKMKCVKLTIEGYDLAMKYNHWFSRMGLWWGEYKGNPIWIVIGYIFTLITGVAIGILIEKYK